MAKNPRSGPTFPGGFEIGPIFPESYEYRLGETDIDSSRSFLFLCAPAVVALHSIGMLHGDLEIGHFLFKPRTGQAFLLDFGASSRAELDPAAMAADLRVAAATLESADFHAFLAGYVQKSLLYLDTRRPYYTEDLLVQLGGQVTYLPWPEAGRLDIAQAQILSGVRLEIINHRVRLTMHTGAASSAGRGFNLDACLAAFGVDHPPLSEEQVAPQPNYPAIKRLIDSTKDLPIEERLELVDQLIDISDYIAGMADEMIGGSTREEDNKTLNSLSRDFAQLSFMLLDASLSRYDRDESRVLTLIRRHSRLSWVPGLLKEPNAESFLPSIGYLHTRAKSFLRLFTNTLRAAEESGANPAWTLLYKSLGILRRVLLSIRLCVDKSPDAGKNWEGVFDQVTKMVLDLLITSLLRHKDALLICPSLLVENVDLLAQIADEAIALGDLRQQLSTEGLAGEESREGMVRATTSYVDMAWQWF